MDRFEVDVIATMDGKGARIIEARSREIEEVRKTMTHTPWEKREILYKKLRELREELDVLRVVAG